MAVGEISKLIICLFICADSFVAKLFVLSIRLLFNALPDSARSIDVVTSLGGAVVAESRKIIEVCGSPGEVGNDPLLGNQYLLHKFGDAAEEFSDTLDQDRDRWHASKILWNTVTLTAPDQLRQRVAWALASIFIVTERDIDFSEVSEPWGAFYDIFVRNGLGSSFFKLLKEVAFSPLMGGMLTYESSRSQAYQMERTGVLSFHEENFVREIMQLFSIGLFILRHRAAHPYLHKCRYCQFQPRMDQLPDSS